MITSLIVVALVALFVGSAGLLIVMRGSTYRRHLSYDPAQSLALGVAGPNVETIAVCWSDKGFSLPKQAIGASSGLLELKINASTTGKIWDPSIELSRNDFSDHQYFERGVHGARFLNISRLLAAQAVPGPVQLHGHGVTWTSSEARLHVCREKITADDRVLVIAPHPDDAEIAAFGLYADTHSAVLTLTAGDASNRYRNSMQPWLSLSRQAVARMRVWDSLTIPQLGCVPPERTFNLCFPDGQLDDMYRQPDRDFTDEQRGLDFSALRRMNRSRPLEGPAKCTWRSLVSDIARIVAEARPTIVVTPHPILDPHPDHLYATVAVNAAIRLANLTGVRMFLYTVHNRRSEMWPFGPAGSGVPMIPILPEDGQCASGFYSHPLSLERQQEKFIALEAMHDVREMQWPEHRSSRDVKARILAELRSLVHGRGRKPTSYLRRAVRPDELFLVASADSCAALADRSLALQANIAA